MKCIIPVQDISERDMSRTGGKAHSLAVMIQKGLNVPAAVAITTEAYDTYVTATGLNTQIMMELNRKTFDDIRWEELWDISLRIRNRFIHTPLPGKLNESIKEALEKYFAGKSVVVRSSAPGEDTSKSSFAGLHESFVNIRGTESVIEHIKLVWASLWSDAALLYRKELGLDENRSSMAVVVQEIVTGDVSGIGFGQSPNDPAQCIIEAVYGLNQGLVDGTLEPDRWILDRAAGKIISHTAAQRSKALYPSAGGTGLASLPAELQNSPPLTDENVRTVYSLLMNTEHIFGLPQDVEWTMKESTLYVLQSRPITTLSGGQKDDQRGWYLSLKRSLKNLKDLRNRIENELIPDIQKETEALAEVDLAGMTDDDMRHETQRRRDIFEKWKKAYWDYFIPFAHGMRLFGTVYNDTVHPEDPYEFLSLLDQRSNIISIQRNDILQKMACLTRGNNSLVKALQSGDYSDVQFSALFAQFVASHGDLLCRSPRCEEERPDIIRMVIDMSYSDMKSSRGEDEKEKKDEAFLSLFEGSSREEAKAMLDIGRASYAMRDNDNIYMGRLKARVLEAEEELSRRSGTVSRGASSAVYYDSLSLDDQGSESVSMPENDREGLRLQTRQITGQPAGPGFATGPAHVIRNVSDLMNFRKGEVLICDSIDPNMTFVVPLASAIIERRGGMLIHGAIIAREYGLPCVTGIAGATEIISNGDRVSVDGYLGIVIIEAAHDTHTVLKPAQND